MYETQLGSSTMAWSNAVFLYPFHRFLATVILALDLFPLIFTTHMLLLEHFLSLHKGRRRRRSAVSSGLAEAD